jgi:hypothetical protein
MSPVQLVSDSSGLDGLTLPDAISAAMVSSTRRSTPTIRRPRFQNREVGRV